MLEFPSPIRSTKGGCPISGVPVVCFISEEGLGEATLWGIVRRDPQIRTVKKIKGPLGVGIMMMPHGVVGSQWRSADPGKSLPGVRLLYHDLLSL
jgi:hypothetical protein